MKLVVLVGLALVAANGCASSSTSPATAPALAGRNVTADDVANKLVFVNRLLEDSPVVQRVLARGNSDARRQVADARRLFARAKRAFDANELRAAEGFLDDSLRLITSAGRAVPERELSLAEQRARYRELLQSIETFRAWNDKVGKQKAAAGQQPSSVAMDADRIRAILKGAEALERADDVAGANKLLEEVQANVAWVLNQLVANETLVYRLEFKDPRDEFQYENDRYVSYEELLPVAVGALTPSGDAGVKADRLFSEAEALRASARQKADAGAHQEAIVLMRDAVVRLQRAYERLGIVVPQDVPTVP